MTDKTIPAPTPPQPAKSSPPAPTPPKNAGNVSITPPPSNIKTAPMPNPTAPSSSGGITPPPGPGPAAPAPLSPPKPAAPASSVPPAPKAPAASLPPAPQAAPQPQPKAPQPLAQAPKSPSSLPPAPPALGGLKPLPKPPGLGAAPTSGGGGSSLSPAPTGGASSGPAPAAAPKAAEVKQSPLRFLPFILAGLVLLGVGFFLFNRIFGGTPQSVVPDEEGTPTVNTNTGTKTPPKSTSQVAITYWGLWEDAAMAEVLQGFESEHPNIKVNYQKQSHQDYRERLQTAIASGRGPDIFRFHASWTPMLRQELSPVPVSIIRPTDFQNIFYPVVSDQLTINGEYMGIPLMYDGLALYYNEEVLKTAGMQPPKTWAELKSMASALTIRDGAKIQRAGVALGNASNVEHFSDIIGLLMYQNGADPANPTSQAAQDALLFYTNFAKTDKVWDETLPSSTVAFARGDVVMMLAPSWRAHEVKSLNPNLKFGIASVPQLANTKVGWASFWAEGVNAQSKRKTESWELLKYLSSQETMRKFYSAAGKERTFGEVYSRRDLANELASDPLVSAYLSDAPVAKGWYLSSYTHDNGINDQIIKYYADAVNAVLVSTDVKTAMDTVKLGTDQILRQYGIVSTP